MKKIDSRTNAFYKQFKSLLTSSGIREHGLALVSGRKLIPEFLKSHGAQVAHLLVADPKEVEQLAFHRKIDVLWLKRELFDEIDEAGTHHPILVVRRPEIPISDLSRPPMGLEVVLAMSNPLNMGAALRSCEAFCVNKVILLKESTNPFLPKVIRASSGSCFNLRLEEGPSIQKLTDKDCAHMTALDLSGDNIKNSSLDKNIRFFIGEEGRGVPNGLQFKKSVYIPIKAQMDSLNALAATSIALYAYRTKHEIT